MPQEVGNSLQLRGKKAHTATAVNSSDERKPSLVDRAADNPMLEWKPSHSIRATNLGEEVENPLPLQAVLLPANVTAAAFVTTSFCRHIFTTGHMESTRSKDQSTMKIFIAISYV